MCTPESFSVMDWGRYFKPSTTFIKNLTFRLVLLPFYFSSDFAEPLILPSMMDPGPSTSDSTMGATPISNNLPPEESIAILTSMGFPRSHTIRALKATVSPLPSPLMIAFDLNCSFLYKLPPSLCLQLLIFNRR